MHGHKNIPSANPLFLALLWAHPFLHVSRIRVNLVFPLKHIIAIRTVAACYCGCEVCICCSTRCGDEHKWWINCIRIWKTTAVSCFNLLLPNLSAPLIKATKLYRALSKRRAVQSRRPAHNDTSTLTVAVQTRHTWCFTSTPPADLSRSVSFWSLPFSGKNKSFCFNKLYIFFKFNQQKLH